MIIGSCPYDDCDEGLWLPLASTCPTFQKHTCDKCERTIWTYHSRVDPHSYTEKHFSKEYEVNEKTKEITEKEIKGIVGK